MVTRTSFCKSCYQKGRPTHDDVYLLYGGTKQGYRVETNEQTRGKRGFTPHLFEKIEKVKAGMVVVKKRCAMHGCGVIVQSVEGGGHTYYLVRDTIINMKLKDWLGLTKFTDSGYEIY